MNESDYNATVDAIAIRNAIEGLGTDEDAIIDIVTNRSNVECVEIVKAYKEYYNRDLHEDLADDLSGYFRDAVLAMFQPKLVYLAKEVHRALKSKKKDYRALTDILCIPTELEVKPVIQHYESLYKNHILHHVDEAIKGDLNTFFNKILVPPLRDCKSNVNKERIIAQVKYLPDNDGKVLDKVLLFEILGKESEEHLRHLCYHYEVVNKSKIRVEEAIEKAFQQPLVDVLKGIIDYIKYPPGYYARVLWNATRSDITDEFAMIRTILTHRETEMIVDIRINFEIMYNTTLTDVLKEKTTGDFRELLIKALGPPLSTFYKDGRISI